MSEIRDIVRWEEKVGANKTYDYPRDATNSSFKRVRMFPVGYGIPRKGVGICDFISIYLESFMGTPFTP